MARVLWDLQASIARLPMGEQAIAWDRASRWALASDDRELATACRGAALGATGVFYRYKRDHCRRCGLPYGSDRPRSVTRTLSDTGYACTECVER